MRFLRNHYSIVAALLAGIGVTVYGVIWGITMGAPPLAILLIVGFSIVGIAAGLLLIWWFETNVMRKG